MPAKKRSFRRKINQPGKLHLPVKKFSYLLFALLFILFVILMARYFTTPNLWVEDEKLSIAVDNGEDGIVVVLLDPVHNEIYKFYYPENLEIEAARNLGKWKIGSLWELGIDEGVGGSLLAHTVTKSIKTPVYAWSGQELLSILDHKYLALPRILFSFNSNTNLSIKDYIKIFRFASGIDNAKLISYTTPEINFITQETLIDGTEGYVISRDAETKIKTLFSDDYIISNPSRAVIISDSENSLKVKQLGEVFEVIGVKIAAIRQETHEVDDCEISAHDQKLASNLSRYLDCEYNSKTSTNFDLEIRIGEKFVSRF